MENLNNNNYGGSIMDNLNNNNSGRENFEEPIPFDSDDMSNTDILHSPLRLDNSSMAEAPITESAVEPVRPVAKKPVEKIVSSADRITGVKTFFTKLHPGAIEFLDGQITNWLNDNPGITIKRTDTTTGLVQGKKTEPNIIITVWY
jgi:hypothetical protein